MSRSFRPSVLTAAVLATALFTAACSGERTSAAAPPEPPPAAIRVAQFKSQPMYRSLRVPGSLAAAEQADVAAETAGRVIGTPVERGTRVAAGTALVRVPATQAG